MLPQKKNIYIFSAVTLFIVVEVSHEILSNCIHMGGGSCAKAV